MSNTTSPSQERYLLLTLAGIQFAHILDFMIMMPLGPMLMQKFSIDTHEFGFLVASYSFSAAVSGLLGALFVDKFERKRLLLILFGLFGLATLACGLANSYLALLIARGLAGIFGGIMGAMVQTMIGDVIPFERRARATSFVATAFSLSTIAGVPLSLWLANHFGWRLPFILIAVLTALFMLIGWKVLPEIRHHMEHRHQPFTSMFEILRDSNQQRALLFSALVIFSGFTIIPYITLYSVGQVDIPLADIPWIYLTGGAATLISGRLIGHWADIYGKTKVYRIVACGAFLPLIAITHINHVALWQWLLCTTLFFVLVSGRMIPAMAIVVSAAQPRLRGTFMALNATAQQLASGLASVLAGFIITQNAAGQIEHYNQVGYVALLANVLAIGLVGYIVMHEQKKGWSG